MYTTDEIALPTADSVKTVHIRDEATIIEYEGGILVRQKSIRAFALLMTLLTALSVSRGALASAAGVWPSG